MKLDWFNLANYDELQNALKQKGWIYSLKLWRRQLLIRQYIKRGLEGMPEWNEVSCQNRRNDAINGWLPMIKKTPIFDDSYEDNLIGLIQNTIQGRHLVFDQPTVRSALCYDLIDDKRLTKIREKALPNLTELIKEMRSIGILVPDGSIPINFILEGAGLDKKGQFTYVMVDLTATDEQITNDFKKWMKIYREATGRIPNNSLRGKATSEKNLQYGENDIKTWIDLKILPYIDLELMRLAGDKIDNNTIAEMLYPEEYYPEDDSVDVAKNDKRLRERITSTRKPKADALLSDEVINAINLQLYSYPNIG